MVGSYLSLVLILALLSCNSQNKLSSSGVGADTSPVKEGMTQVSLPENGFYCGFADSKGTLWFGSMAGGVYRFDGTGFAHITEADGLSDNNVCAIAEDRDGNLWFGTAKGLCRYDGNVFAAVPIPQSDTSSIWLDKVYPVVNPNQIVSILQDRKGSLWIGTNGAGVYRYDGITFSRYLSDVGMVYEDGEHHNIVLRIIEDRDGNLWFSSLSHGGVSRYDGSTFTHFTDELSDDFVRTVLCDREGNIWIGTHGNHAGGLDLYDGRDFTHFHKTDDGFSDNNVRWIYEDRDGKFWIGSGRGNLSTFDGKNFTEFVADDGETFPFVFFVLEDQDDNIWFGGKEGLWRFDGTTVTSMIAG